MKKQQKLCRICGKDITGSNRLRLYCGEECAYQGKLATARRHDRKKKERMVANGEI